MSHAKDYAKANLIATAIGMVLKKLRREKNLSGRALSGIVGVSQQTISATECADRALTIAALHRLTTALGISLSEMIRQVETTMDFLEQGTDDPTRPRVTDNYTTYLRDQTERQRRQRGGDPGGKGGGGSS